MKVAKSREERIAAKMGVAAQQLAPNYDTFPGAALIKINRERYHISACASCIKTAKKMDRYGVDWCRDNVKELALELHANAQERLWTSMLDGLAWGVFGDEKYCKLILEACDAADPAPQGPAKDACFVWTYYSGEAQGDELRWSMRSVLQNYFGHADIVLIGDAPKWYCGEHIEMPRIAECYRWRYADVLHKLIAACRSDLVADTFCWMNDDIYALNRFTFDWLAKNVHQGVNPPASPKLWGNAELQSLHSETYDAIREKLPDKANQICDHATHRPKLFSKREFLEMVQLFDLENRTLHWDQIFPVMFHESSQLVDFTHQLIRSSVELQLDDAVTVSNGHLGWDDRLRRLLSERFPDRCEVESHDPDFTCPHCGK